VSAAIAAGVTCPHDSRESGEAGAGPSPLVGRLEIWLAAMIVALDQVSKAILRSRVPLHDDVPVVPGLLSFTHVRNTGAAFGMFNAAEFPFKAAVIAIVAAAALVAIAAYAARLAPGQKMARVGLAFILGGAIGNLIDRVAFGYVLDFVDVYWRSYHFWAFNVADAAITVGAVLVLVDMIGLGRRRHASHSV
jgi:signal peptidase II